MRITLGCALSAVIFAAALVSQAPAADAPNAPLSADEVKKLVNAGQYQDALKSLLRILELKGPAAAGYDRHEMLMLRAECQLQLKQYPAATDTLETARKEAAALADEKQVMEASALFLLIKASPGGNYTPQTGAMRKPIPILDRILRKAAYDALFADQLAQVTIKARLAKTANQLKPLAEAAQLVVAARPVEKASAGDNKQTDLILADLATQSLKMISGAVDDMTADTKRISDSANRVITENMTIADARGNSYVTPITHRVGLGKQDSQTLKNDITESAKVVTAANELAQFFSSGDPAPFKAVAAKAQANKDKATTVLNDDYTSAVH